ncbi:MAG: alpha/beta fold hydrolase, partial [Lachnospiraceae bacterium]
QKFYLKVTYDAGAPTEESPEGLRRPKRAGRSAYLATQGANEFQATGIFKDWEYRSRLREIEIPSLIISGTNDLCTPLIAKTMYDRLPNARWELFPGCRHMCFVEDNERYCALLSEWMEQYD